MTSKKQRLDVFEFVKLFIATRGYPPTTQEIVEGTDVASKSHANKILYSLEEAGYLELVQVEHRRTSRGIRLPDVPYTRHAAVDLAEMILSFESGFSYSRYNWELSDDAVAYLNEMCDAARKLLGRKDER